MTPIVDAIMSSDGPLSFYGYAAFGWDVPAHMWIPYGTKDYLLPMNLAACESWDTGIVATKAGEA